MMGADNGPIALHAEGFTLTIQPLPPRRKSRGGPRFFSGTLALSSDILGESYTLHQQIECELTDLQRLGTWIEEHVQTLVTESSQVSPPKSGQALLEHIRSSAQIATRTWVPLDLSMEVSLLVGDLWREDKTVMGSFTVRVMIRAAKDLQGPHIYAGFEGTMSAKEALGFSQVLQEYVASN
jgi:hypothetical protein